MDKQQIKEVLAKQEALYEKNFAAYQETGMKKYETAYRKAEDMADLCRMALANGGDMQEMYNIKADMISLGGRANSLIRGGYNKFDAIKLLKDLISAARMAGLDVKWIEEE